MKSQFIGIIDAEELPDWCLTGTYKVAVDCSELGHVECELTGKDIKENFSYTAPADDEERFAFIGEGVVDHKTKEALTGRLVRIHCTTSSENHAWASPDNPAVEVEFEVPRDEELNTLYIYRKNDLKPITRKEAFFAKMKGR